METYTRPHPSTRFNAAAARERHARAYLTRLRPGILALVVVLMVVDELIAPASINEGTWLTVAGFLLAQPILLLALHRTGDAMRVVGASLVLDGAIFLAVLPFVVSPTNAAASLVILVTAFSYFEPPRATIAFAVVLSTAITLVGPHIRHWNDPAPYPASAFIVLSTGLLLAYLTSRMRDTERQLERVVGEQEQALERLVQVDRARERIIASVSHELRTPLTSTIGSIETLLRDDIELDEVQRARLLQIARDGGLRLLVLVEDLLTLGATRPDSLDLSTEREVLTTIARDAVVGLDAGPDRTISVVGIDGPPVRVDRLRMLQVVANLVINAVNHGRGGVVVETDARPGQAILRVLDEGDGVPPEHVGELFLPFARFSTRSDSTGLGLAICRTIVEAHGGSIRYERTRDQRTSFVVELPIVDEAPAPT